MRKRCIDEAGKQAFADLFGQYGQVIDTNDIEGFPSIHNSMEEIAGQFLEEQEKELKKQ